MTLTHPLRSALLRRAAGFSGDCTAEETDRILRVMFPHLDPEPTLLRLTEAREHHLARRSVAAERIIQQLAEPAVPQETS